MSPIVGMRTLRTFTLAKRDPSTPLLSSVFSTTPCSVERIRWEMSRRPLAPATLSSTGRGAVFPMMASSDMTGVPGAGRPSASSLP